MMRVYQPLCPDITFRLAADLSPDALEDETSPSSSSSSSSEEEPKLKIFQESSSCHSQNNNNHHHHQHHPAWYTQHASANTAPATAATTAAASPAASKCAKEIYNQGHSSSQTTAATSSATATTTTTTARPFPSCSSTSSPTSASATASAADPMSLSSQSEGDGLEKCHQELEPRRGHRDTAVGDSTSGPSQPSPPPPPPVSSSSSLSIPPDDVERAHKAEKTSPYCEEFDDEHHKGSEDHEDADSVEDVSISQNVPNATPISTPSFPSPSGVSSSSPPSSLMLGRRLVTRAEEGGGASGSSSDSEGPLRSKSPRLHLDIQRPLGKYHGPYTLACDITPSPMQEGVNMASTLPSLSVASNGDASAATTSATTTAAITTPTSASTATSTLKVPRRPRKLPEIPRKHQGLATASSTMERSIFDEIQEALIKEVSDDVVFDASSTAPDAEPSSQYPFILKHAGYLFDKKRLLIGYATGAPSRSRTVSTSSVASEAGAAASMEEEMSAAHAQSRTSGGLSSASMCGQRRRKNSDGDGSRRFCSTMSTPYQDLEVTHRGMHRFIPRHADEVQIGIGDPIHVVKEYDDLWCEGVNLRTGERGIFPGMYANDLRFLEDSDGDGDEHWKFTMRYLGSVEVTAPSGDFALCQAINKVAQQGRIKTASLCILEINQYGIRMIDKSKEGHESQKFSNFFALKNISFCGTHPNNKRYFAFITKHPRENRFACHVFHSDRSTHRARDALGNAFKRFYQEYMAFTHPTEDIWIE